MERKSITPCGCSHNTLADCLFVLTLMFSASVWADPQYFVKDIGTLDGDTYSSANSINNAGAVVGVSGNAGSNKQRAFHYNNAVMIDLLDDGSNSIATSINNNGQVVGVYGSTGGEARVFFSDNGQIKDLGISAVLIGLLPNTTNPQINDAGQVVGTSGTIGNALYAFLYSSGDPTNLGTLDGDYHSAAHSINNKGEVVGLSSPLNYWPLTSFLYSNSKMAPLGALELFFYDTYVPTDINDAGQVVGGSTFYNAPPINGIDLNTAFLYSNKVMIPLGILEGGIYSYALGINASGQVVGTSDTSLDQHAFLYSNGQMIDLNTLIDPSSGWTLEEATAINDSGQIVGYGSFGGQKRAFLASPFTVPPAVLETPQQPNTEGLQALNYNPTATNMVLVTHGWNSDALPGEWVQGMAEGIQWMLLNKNTLSDWDIYTYDWSQDAGNFFKCPADTVNPWTSNSPGCPKSTLPYAKDHGEKLARIFVNNKNYEYIHLIGHSAGSNLIDKMARKIKDLCKNNGTPCPRIHTTFLDAYDPSLSPGRNYGGGGEDEGSDWADHYVDKRSPLFALGTTNRELTNAINFDVTALDPSVVSNVNPQGSHAWPYEWYTCSISPIAATYCQSSYTAGDLSKFGYTMALEYGGIDVLPSLPVSSSYKTSFNGVVRYLKKGDDCVLSKNAICGVKRPPIFQGISSTNDLIAITFPKVLVTQISPTGVVSGLPDYSGITKFILTPRSPAWVSSAIETTESVNMIQFDYEFLALGEDLLSVFVDELLVYRADQRDAEVGINHSGEVLIDNLAPGVHIVSFRVDPFGTEKAPVEISNLTTSTRSTLTADAGESQIVYPGRTITLDGSGSEDTRGVVLTYDWSQIEGNTVALSNTNARTTTFVSPPSGTDGQVLSFQLSVANPENTLVADEITVEVVKLGDVNADGVVNMNDMNIVLEGRGTSASGANDLRDLDADGNITALDARQLTRLCSKPRCAI